MRLLSLTLIALCLSGCATVIEGYKSDLEIINPPSDLQVSTIEGVHLPLIPKTGRVAVRDSVTRNMKYIDRPLNSAATIQLRSNKEYVLVLKYGSIEKRIEVSPKLNVLYFLLDVICGVLPVIPDAATGNWNYFEPIYLGQ